MIARPVTRPRPIPYAQPAQSARPPHPVSWTASSGALPQAPTSGEMQARFMGHGALSVRSAATGRHYRFQGHGDCLQVDKHDMMMLRRIPDLVVS